MTKTVSSCLVALFWVPACGGHAIDLDASATSSSSADPVGVETILLPDSISHLLAGDARVYWVGASETEQSCVFDRCSATTLNYGRAGWPVTLGAQDVVFPTFANNGLLSGHVFGCPKTGCIGAPRELLDDATAPDYYFVVEADDGYLYWSSRTDIYRCPVTGCGEVPEIVAKGETSTGGLVVDGDQVFWTFAPGVFESGTGGPSQPNTNGPPLEIHNAPKDGSRPPMVLVSGVGPSYDALNFTVDATSLYWIDDAAHVRSCPRTGCDGQAATTLVASDGAKRALSVDASGLYWSETADLVGDWQSAQHSAIVDNVSIRYCPLTGCAQGADAQILTPSKVGDFALSSNYLYWNEPQIVRDAGGHPYTHGDSKQIFRTLKPSERR